MKQEKELQKGISTTHRDSSPLGEATLYFFAENFFGFSTS
jgi:hypothetical protein